MQAHNVSVWLICKECEKPCVKKVACLINESKINISLEAKKAYLLNDLKIIPFFDICNMRITQHRQKWVLASFDEVKQILNQEPDYLSDLSVPYLTQQKKDINGSESRFANIDLID